MKWVLVHPKEMKMSNEAIQDLVQAAIDQNFNKANEVFSDMMSDKVFDALNQEKIAVADRIYNGVEPEQDDYEVDDDVDQQYDPDLELSDEEIEAELEDEINDETEELEN